MNELAPVLAPLVINFLRYFLLAGIPFLIFYILYPNVFSRNKIQKRLAKRKDFIREILHSMQTTLILVAVGLSILLTPLKEYTAFYHDISAYPLWWIPVSILLGLILHDTYFYWMHRTVHHPRLFKRVHLLHHKSVNPSPWASYSFHFFEGILEALIAPIILFLIPMHPIAFILFTTLAFIINVYGHLGYEIAPKWLRHTFLFEIVNTSVHHNLHHSRFKGNYGLYFRVWDRIMGTEHPDYVKEYDKIQEKRFGEKKVNDALKQAVLILLLIGFTGVSSYAQSSLQGKWKDHAKGAVVEIYEENGMFYGKLISSDDPKENEKLQNLKKTQHKEVLILRDFEKKSDTKFCCGVIFQPKYQRTMEGNLILKDDNTLKINGKFGILTGSRTWTKIQEAEGAHKS
ncbi:MAG: sterol desaturase family protein [Bacteroidota bacterium]